MKGRKPITSRQHREILILRAVGKRPERNSSALLENDLSLQSTTEHIIPTPKTIAELVAETDAGLARLDRLIERISRDIDETDVRIERLLRSKER